MMHIYYPEIVRLSPRSPLVQPASSDDGEHRYEIATQVDPLEERDRRIAARLASARAALERFSDALLQRELCEQVKHLNELRRLLASAELEVVL